MNKSKQQGDLGKVKVKLQFCSIKKCINCKTCFIHRFEHFLVSFSKIRFIYGVENRYVLYFENEIIITKFDFTLTAINTAKLII